MTRPLTTAGAGARAIGAGDLVVLSVPLTAYTASPAPSAVLRRALDGAEQTQVADRVF